MHPKQFKFQEHYNRCINNGGSHEEFLLMNPEVDPELSEELQKNHLGKEIRHLHTPPTPALSTRQFA